MKILHTADLHLGRQFNGISLEEDHAKVLEQIVRAVCDNAVDVLIIAGDIFDRTSPPVAAVQQFNAFIRRIQTESKAAVVMIAGNHDAPDRIEAMSIMQDTSRAHIRGRISANEETFVIEDEHGPVAFSGLPFAYEYSAKECFDDESIQNPQGVLLAQIKSARKNVPEGARWVVIAHTFVSGGSTSDSEKMLTRVGGIETVSADTFEGAHYVALGHLHRPQKITSDHIRYSGSPLAFGFDEGTDKSMCLVEMGADGAVTIEKIPFVPIRNVRTITGKHAELIQQDPSNDFIKAVLTDDVRVIDGMKQLRKKFPNACDLVYEREQSNNAGTYIGNSARTSDPISVINKFLETMGENPADEIKKKIIADAIQHIQQGENAT